MKGYILPNQYIWTYFIRTIHYDIIHKNKYPLNKLFQPISLETFSKFKSLDLVFHFSGKQKRYNLIRKGKTNLKYINKKILKTRLYIHPL